MDHTSCACIFKVHRNFFFQPPSSGKRDGVDNFLFMGRGGFGTRCLKSV